MERTDLKTVLTDVRSGGCVQPHLEGFAAELLSAGYSVLSIRDYLRSAAHLGRWLDSRIQGIKQLTAESVAEFARHRCACPFAHRRGRYPSGRYVARVRRFIEYLARQDIVSLGALPLPDSVPEPLVGFRSWMIHHRGLKGPTIDRYESLIKKMLPALGIDPTRFLCAGFWSAE